MFSPAIGDVILRASIDGTFRVIDAVQQTRVAGPFPLRTALAYAHAHGAPHIFQQAVDTRGRILGESGAGEDLYKKRQPENLTKAYFPNTLL